MDCKCSEPGTSETVEQNKAMEAELADTARKILKAATDPFTGAIRFFAERPENAPMPGSVVNGVFDQIFAANECPGLLRLMASHLKEVIRRGKIVELIKVHATSEPFRDFAVKQVQSVKFEVGDDNGRMVLKNIQGLIGIEHGIELPVEKILVSPPNLIVTVKLGLMRPQKTVAI